MPDSPAPALREQPCSRCGELVAWDDEQPVVCIDCLQAALAEAHARADRLQAERDEARANADFLRESVGECHLMLSRGTSTYQLRDDWDSTSLPYRVARLGWELAKHIDTLADAKLTVARLEAENAALRERTS